MATTTATITLSSTDLLSDELALATTATLTEAGNSTGLVSTSGLARKTTATVAPYTLFHADDYTADKAHKLYLKNTSTNAAYYYDIGVGVIGNNTTLGRIYAGDWALIPWSATDGTKEVFTITLGGTWATADTLTFDGVTISPTNTAHADTAAVIRATYYPNWVVTGSGSDAIFTARRARSDQEIDTDEWTLVDAGGSDATISVATTTEGLADPKNIIITPGGSSTNSVTLEYMLFNE
jgi:hypothetical protein